MCEFSHFNLFTYHFLFHLQLNLLNITFNVDFPTELLFNSKLRATNCSKLSRMQKCTSHLVNYIPMQMQQVKYLSIFMKVKNQSKDTLILTQEFRFYLNDSKRQKKIILKNGAEISEFLALKE